MSAEQLLSNISTAAFDSLVMKLRTEYDVPSEKISRDDFDRLDDLRDFFKHYHDVEDVHITAEDMSVQMAFVSRTQAKTKSMTNAMVAKLVKQKANEREEAKKRSLTRGRTSPKPEPKSGQVRRTSPASIFSDLVSPGLYTGADPFQIIDSRPVGPEIDPGTPKFRRQRTAVGKCTGNKLKAVKRAYLAAYCLVEGARREINTISRNSDAGILWHGSVEYVEASLAYWFGADYSPAQMSRMLTRIEGILTEWSLSFCAGFRGLLPVFIRCKSVNAVGDGTLGRHLVKNTIELTPAYFNLSRNQQTITLLHEMGHRSTAMLKPRDERHDLCSGGWNRKENMCYREHDEIDQGRKIFIAGSPRLLAEAAENGNTSARQTALNNIDNYVCYMWNRQRDHGLNHMYLLTPGTKPSRRPAGSSKPSS
jgi:hypothetical protein